MSGAVHTAPVAPARRAPRHMPSLPALRAGVSMPTIVPRLRRPRPLADAIEPFLFWLGGVRGRRPLTLKAYREDLVGFAAFCQEARIEDPRAIRHSHIEFFLAWLQSPGGRSASTAARHLSTLRSSFKHLLREDIVDRDPAAVSFGPKVTRRLPVYLATADQERVLLDLARDRTVKGRRDHAVITTLLLTGLRAGELVSLDLGHLNLDAGTLRVVNGKGGKDRELPVVPRLGAILRAYLLDVRPALYHADTSAAVFLPLDGRGPGPAAAGGRLGYRWLWRLVALRVGAITSRKLSPHKLRHSFASRLRANGADLALIQEAMGHSEIGTTMIYAHLSTPERQATLTRFLGGTPAPPVVVERAAESAWAATPLEPTRVTLPRRRRDATVGPHWAAGHRIRSVRHRLRLRQRDLAAQLGVGLMTVVRAERGRVEGKEATRWMPRLSLLQGIAELGGVTVDWLLKGDRP